MMKGLTPYTFDPQIRYAEWNELTKRLYEQNQKTISFSLISAQFTRDLEFSEERPEYCHTVVFLNYT